MSKLNRSKLQKMILQEFKMMGMTDMQPMGKIGHALGTLTDAGYEVDATKSHHGFAGDDMGEDALMGMHSSDHTPMMGGGMMKSSKSCVSREDCCAAVMCLIECCSCPVTKQALMQCCQDIMAGDYDH